MRRTRYVFFLILIILTAVLVFIIVGESKSFTKLETEEIVDLSTRPKPSLLTSYQLDLNNLLHSYQRQILMQSMTREDAILEIREKVLSFSSVPVEMQDLHWQLLRALTKDLDGYQTEAKQIYQQVLLGHNWLITGFAFLLN